MIFGYVDMTVYFNGKKYQQLGFMHLKVDVIIFSRNESVFDLVVLPRMLFDCRGGAVGAGAKVIWRIDAGAKVIWRIGAGAFGAS